jgi:hypothetical protein
LGEDTDVFVVVVVDAVDVESLALVVVGFVG